MCNSMLLQAIALTSNGPPKKSSRDTESKSVFDALCSVLRIECGAPVEAFVKTSGSTIVTSSRD